MKKENEIIHHIQNSYRVLVKAFSNPGTIEKINCSHSLETLARVLLDREVSFFVDMKNKYAIEKRIIELTGAKCKEKDFDYLFVDYLEKRTLDNAKVGTLISPEKSTTIFKQINKFSKMERVLIEGPGIKGEKEILIALEKEELKIRELKNKEYPLGIDIILFSEEGELMVIPRTSKIKIKENE